MVLYAITSFFAINFLNRCHFLDYIYLSQFIVFVSLLVLLNICHVSLVLSLFTFSFYICFSLLSLFFSFSLDFLNTCCFLNVLPVDFFPLDAFLFCSFFSFHSPSFLAFLSTSLSCLFLSFNLSLYFSNLCRFLNFLLLCHLPPLFLINFSHFSLALWSFTCYVYISVVVCFRHFLVFYFCSPHFL